MVAVFQNRHHYNLRLTNKRNSPLNDYAMNWEWMMSACLGIGLAACCGFRVFVPLFMAALGQKIGFIGPLSGAEWLNSWPGLLVLGV